MKSNNPSFDQGSQQSPQQDDAADTKKSESPFPASLLELDALQAMLGTSSTSGGRNVSPQHNDEEPGKAIQPSHI